MSAFPYRIGHGYDVHALGGGLELWLGGVRIPHVKGCIAHSDGDVAIHALCDAMLGALALGDIGQHFPDTDERYSGANSLELLRETVRLVSDAGYRVGNIDATVIAQAPKMAPYIDEMRRNIADACKVDIKSVSVKATTEEKLGFTGSMQGMSAHSVCLIYAK